MRRRITCDVDERYQQVKCVEERTEELKVLFLDDDPKRVDAYENEFPDHDLVWDRSPFIAAYHARTERFDIISMDFNLEFRGLDGMDAAKILAENAGASEDALFVIHSMNPLGARRMEAALKEVGREVVRVQFWDPTYFKLISNVDDPLLPAPRAIDIQPPSLRKRIKQKLPYVAVGFGSAALMAILILVIKRKK